MDQAPRWEVPRAVIDAYRFDDRPLGSWPVSGGHIHRTFLVTCSRSRYVLQRLNERVFPDVGAVLSNVERVVAHLRAKGRNGPNLLETHDGALSLRADDGSLWRAFHFLEGTVGRATLSGPTDAFETARVFGDYQMALSDLPGPPLAETITHFHDLHHRLAALESAVTSDRVGRLSGVGDELGGARRLGQQLADELDDSNGRTPQRTVHNDAKLANVRFDVGTGLATCVVDLDTTMPGSVRHDVGELVRTMTTHAPEDARDVEAVDFDLELLDALCTGFFTTQTVLGPPELDTMALAGPQMATENAVRFLTDHLAGDLYFAVDRPGQNLDRCRVQLRLAALMLASQAEADACFARAARRPGPADPHATVPPAVRP